MPVGANNKLTPELIEKLASYIEQGNYAKTAAKACKITEQTYYRWLREAEGAETKRKLYNQTQPEDRAALGVKRLTQHEQLVLDLVDAIETADARAEAEAVKVLNKVALGDTKDNWKAAIEYLQRRHRQEWSRSQSIEHTGTQKNIQVNINYDELNDEEVEAIMQGADPEAVALRAKKRQKFTPSD